MIKWDDFKDQFHESWWKWIQPIIESSKFSEDFEMLKKEGKAGKVIPSSASDNLFRVFRETSYEDMVVVVVGLSPYNSYLGDVEIADGLAMSCSNTNKEQPTLTKWYDAMEVEFGKSIERDPNLLYLAKRGALLYNISLTTGYKQATSHLHIWEHFSKELFTNAISASGVPIITLGKEADKVGGWVLPWQRHYSLKHPAYASYAKIPWDSEGVFAAVEKELLGNGIHFKWIKEKNKF